MDWATFFKDYGQSLFTLGGVLLGSLITFLINYLNNRFQAKERDKDRDEQRRETKLQAKEKYIERDILLIIDTAEKMMSWLSRYDADVQQMLFLSEKKDAGSINNKELHIQVNSLLDKNYREHQESNRLWGLAGKLVHSFEEPEIMLAFDDFMSATDVLLNKLYDALRLVRNKNLSKKSFTRTDEWNVVMATAGKLHQALRNKLISIRDSET